MIIFLSFFIIYSYIVIGKSFNTEKIYNDFYRSLELDIGKCRFVNTSNILEITNHRDNIFKIYFNSINDDMESLRDFQHFSIYTRSNEAFSRGEVARKSRIQSFIKNNPMIYIDHPRRNRTNCIRLSQLVSERPAILYDEYNEIFSQSYLIHAKNAIIDKKGKVVVKCGFIQALENCDTLIKMEGQNFWKKSISALKSRNISFQYDEIFSYVKNDLGNSLYEEIFKPPRFPLPAKKLKYIFSDIKELPLEEFLFVDKVFVLNSKWDYNYHHLLIDVMSKYAYYREFLTKNPDIKIMFRMAEDHFRKSKNIKKVLKVKKRIIEFFDIDRSRIVWGDIVAKEVYFPRAIKCSLSVFHPLEIRYFNWPTFIALVAFITL